MSNSVSERKRDREIPTHEVGNQSLTEIGNVVSLQVNEENAPTPAELHTENNERGSEREK